MIKARHHVLYVWFFKWYSRLMIRWHFASVHVRGLVENKEQAVLLIGNHFSWWDGFFANFLNYALFHKRYHVMMLEQQLATRMFLNKAGAFSINKGSRTVVETLQYTVQTLQDTDNLVVMFPQGAIQSLYTRPLYFEQGVGYILKKTYPTCGIYFYAALVDYFSSPKPHLYFYLQKAVFDYTPDAEMLQTAYNQFFDACIEQQKTLAV